MSNKRQHIRVPLRVVFTARDEASEGTMVFDSADLSSGGSFLKSDLLLDENEILDLEFRLPTSDAKLTVRAVVVWVRPEGSEDKPTGMGVKFTNLTDEDTALLEKAINATPNEST